VGAGLDKHGLGLHPGGRHCLSARAHTQIFAGLVKKAAVPRITVHGLRHTHATLALAAGIHTPRWCPSAWGTPPWPLPWRDRRRDGLVTIGGRTGGHGASTACGVDRRAEQQQRVEAVQRAQSRDGMADEAQGNLRYDEQQY
jgi:hypothetical protein